MNDRFLTLVLFLCLCSHKFIKDINKEHKFKFMVATHSSFFALYLKLAAVLYTQGPGIRVSGVEKQEKENLLFIL